MPTEKRRRKKEGHRARLEAARVAARRQQRRRQALTAGALVAALFLVFLAVSVLGGDDDEQAPTEDTADDVAAGYGTGACAPTARPKTLPKTFAAAPRRCIEDGTDYRAVITTSEGVITVDLDEAKAPITVNNFVTLARWGWFDGEGFHRVVPGFVNQAGNAAGRGNPGYTIKDELPASLAAYTKGTLAMANRGADTGGSQWFICIDCAALPGPNFAAFGAVTDGIAVADAINALGVGDAPPSRPVTITSVQIIEG